MKQILRKLFKPLLDIFESGDGPYAYKPLNRKILLTVGVLFGAIGGFVSYYIIVNKAYGYFLPAVVFSGVCLVCLVVGSLGNERAVAKIWGNK